MGEMGVSWFRHCGYATDKIFPFSYITEGNDSKKSSSLSKYLSFLYVGQFITRKGLDILMRAFAKTGTDRACLNLLGDGPDKSRLQNLSRTLGIADRVSWHPKRDAFGAQIETGKADVTVLPSRHDGWGAVVNESLMMGTPVICSTACGAAELIREPWLGSVFRSGHVADLARALQFWIDQGPRTQPERERIRKWAKCIQGQAVANYFIAIMEHVYSNAKRPVAPWRLPLENR
jgi:glycosyltransferase involved in cell wall biosynthesis